MALPSSVTLGSAAVIIAAGVRLVAVSSLADEEPATKATGTAPTTTVPSTNKIIG